jgi:hypothetical protein
MGDEGNFTLEGMPVMHPEISFPAAFAAAGPGIHDGGRELPFRKAEAAPGCHQVYCGEIEEVKA